MSWTYRVARVAGVDIKIHATFLFIVLLFAFWWGSMHGLWGALFGVLLILGLFFCVTLHELGHSLTAQHYGIPVREIVLFPLGGVALLGANAKKPLHELLIALAGPLVNVAIVAVLLIVLAIGYDLAMLDTSALVQGEDVQLSLSTLLIWLLEANILLVVFNMIPAFPLDGGRVLRALLAMRLGQRRATHIASRVGQGFALLLGLFALFTFQFFLLLIALFIFFGARQEYAVEQATTVLSTRRVGDVYNKHSLTLSLGDRVSKVLDYILTSYQPDFAVVQGNRLLGVVTRDSVLQAMARAPEGVDIPNVYVTHEEVMRREVLRVEADAKLDDVRDLLVARSERLAAVYDGERFLGLINIEDIAEAFTVLSYMARYGPPHSEADSPDAAASSDAADGAEDGPPRRADEP